MTNWWQKLEGLRREPEAKRKRILWWSTSLLTILIILLWLLAWRLSARPVFSPVLEPASETNWLADAKLKIITGWKTLILTK
ncbi:hypothetical protein IT398_00235 [Candidatus Nomurabacteria bacterium]|nr:hypothetical protein [Candidatus Nomurabacteria bacterium]